MTDNSALFQLGMDLDAPGTTRAEDYYNNNVVPFARDDHAAESGEDLPADHFIVKDGVACAGTHLIIDLVDADGLADVDLIDAAMRECVSEAGATLLHIHLHPFTPEGVAGVSGVAVLAEATSPSTPGPSGAMRRWTCSCAAMPGQRSAWRFSAAASTPARFASTSCCGAPTCEPEDRRRRHCVDV